MKNINIPSQYSLKKGIVAFTLVELIVVITILSILWTIWFLSFKWYIKDARDSTRLSDIWNIEKQLDLFFAKSWEFPIPENNVELKSSWTIIWYQWYIWEKILWILKIFNWWLDPIDQNPYIYRINWNKDSYQIMWFLEKWNVAYTPLKSYSLKGEGVYPIFPQANATTNFTNRFPLSKWKVLWIILEQKTNTPIQDIIKTWIVNLRTDIINVDLYLTNTSIKKWLIKDIYWILEKLSISQNFDKPEKKCKRWFIAVPWNKNLWQPAFCVAKYEMSYASLYWDNPHPTIWDWNTVAYTWVEIPISMAWRYPITYITQLEAISSCKSIWVWYHLITNNEWMTIARNIEQQSLNWSSWIVWSWYVYNWVSNWTSWCNINLTSTTWRILATKTWDSNCTWQKNKLTLSNWEEIWDLAWNVKEHVNKANTLDWTNNDLWQTKITWWSSPTSRDDDWIYSVLDMNKYGSVLWYWKYKW